MSEWLAFDPGFGNTKLYGQEGGVMLPSSVSATSATGALRMAGLRAAKPPLLIETSAGSFAVGEHAHDWGRPVENLDLDRLTASPETMALFYGVLTKYDVASPQISLVIGLPISATIDPASQEILSTIRSSFRGNHTWLADGQTRAAGVDRVRVTSQPVGAMFDYLLDEEGNMSASRQIALKGEIGIVGIGMNTVDLLVVRNGAAVRRFAAGQKLGVRRLLELSAQRHLYSLAELDGQLRTRSLDVFGAQRVWQSEVIGFIERCWGDAHRRFSAVVASGGGSIYLREALLRRFRDKLFVADDCVMSTVRGLYKYAMMSARRANG